MTCNRNSLLLNHSVQTTAKTSFLLKTMEKAVDYYIRTGVIDRWHPAVLPGAGGIATALTEFIGVLQKSLGEKETVVYAILKILKLQESLGKERCR